MQTITKRRSRLHITLSAASRPMTPPSGVDHFSVAINHDGTVTLTADATTMARLAGRKEIGSAGPVQAFLQDRIAGAWYDDGARAYS